MSDRLFKKILHANDGSDQALEAFDLALAIAKQSGSELHIVVVGEIEHVPLFVQEIDEQEWIAADRLKSLIARAEMALAEKTKLGVHNHVLVGHPVRDIVSLARDLDADLLVIGAKGHSAFYERVIGSRSSRIMQLAHCPVLAVKSNRGWRPARNRSKFMVWNHLLGAAARYRPAS